MLINNMFRLLKNQIQAEYKARNENICYFALHIERNIVLHKIIRGIVLV